MALSEAPQQGSGGARSSDMGWQIILLFQKLCGFRLYMLSATK
jgi:hypothetical protein